MVFLKTIDIFRQRLAGQIVQRTVDETFKNNQLTILHIYVTGRSSNKWLWVKKHKYVHTLYT